MLNCWQSHGWFTEDAIHGFCRQCPMTFQNHCATSYSHQLCSRVPVVIFLPLVCSVFSTLASLVGAWILLLKISLANSNEKIILQ